MKPSKHWVIPVVIFAFLAISTNFTHRAMAEAGQLVTVSRMYFPLILNYYWPSATSLTSHVPDPSVPGQAVVVSVTVSGAGMPVPTGTVNISGADSNCSLLLAGGSGSCSVSFNTTGHKTLTATYSGDGVYAPSSGSAGHIVVPGPTTLTIISDMPDPSLPGQVVMVSFTVGGAGAMPTGTVAITGADINCSLALSGGSGSCGVIFNTIGARVLTATYSGDANYLGSTDSEPHAVKNPTTTSITSHVPEASVPGELVTVTITVAGDGVIAPTGMLTLTGSDDAGLVSCGLVGGTCAVSVVFNTAGARTLTATYGGDAIYAGSTGTASHTVNRGTPIAFGITGDTNDPSLVNEIVTVQIVILGAGAIPTGSVAISVSGQASSCSITLSGGGGQCQIAFNAVGVYTILATYSGDNNYLGVTDTEIHTVN